MAWRLLPAACFDGRPSGRSAERQDCPNGLAQFWPPKKTCLESALPQSACACGIIMRNNNMDKKIKKTETPYFLFDISKFRGNISRYAAREFALNYSVKSCLFKGLIQKTESLLDGVTVSSKGDLRKVREETEKPIHFVSPLIRLSEIEAISQHGNSVAFNSFGQFQRLAKYLNPRIQALIRINPEKSFVKDSRYDPCRQHSHLGVPLSAFSEYIKKNRLKIDGLHFHNNCQSRRPADIIKTMEHIENHLGSWLSRLKRVNIGGGYVYQESLIKAVNKLQGKWREKYGLKRLAMEPGFDISNSAGLLVSSVIDVFAAKGGKKTAVLDTTVNHLPEALEYNERPDVLNSHENGGFSYIVAGCSCLAGDVFGEYGFKDPLNIGDLVIFKNVGAYSYVKANAFNGIEKPRLII